MRAVLEVVVMMGRVELAIDVRLVACFRDDRARGPTPMRARLEDLEGSFARNGAHLKFSAQWADEHPRTAYLLREEAELWARQGVFLLALN